MYSEPPISDAEKLRQENEELKRKLAFFSTEHRFAARLGALVLLGPGLVKSIRAWMLRATIESPLPTEETSTLIAAIVRRLLTVGLVGLLIPVSPLVWQNLLIKDQNRYFREQTEELRRQIEIQQEQSDLTRRKDLLESVYDSAGKDLSVRTRVEALKALVRLDNELLERGVIPGLMVNLRDVDFSCDGQQLSKCADFSSAWLPRVDFSGSIFIGANFEGADLRDSIFANTDLSGANFVNAELEGARFRYFIPSLVYADLEGRVPIRPRTMSGLSPGVIDELQAIWKLTTLVGDWRERRVRYEFALERVRLSVEAVSQLNAITQSARVEGARFNFSEQGRERYVDHFARIPVGLGRIQSGGAVRRLWDTHVRIAEIQMDVDSALGPYRANVDIGSGRGQNSRDVYCTSPGVFTPAGERLEEYRAKTAPEKEDFVKRVCVVRRLRLKR